METVPAADPVPAVQAPAVVDPEPDTLPAAEGLSDDEDDSFSSTDSESSYESDGDDKLATIMEVLHDQRAQEWAKKRRGLCVSNSVLLSDPVDPLAKSSCCFFY